MHTYITNPDPGSQLPSALCNAMQYHAAQRDTSTYRSLGFVGLQDGLKMAPRIQKTERTTYAQNDKENDNENDKVC